jgi:imidazolonepropionase-like amidohydrolase
MQGSNTGAPRRRLAVWALAALLPPALAQESTVPSEGLGQAPNTHVALTNARIVLAPGRVLENATLVMREGRIVSVEAGTRVPAGALARDMGGKTLFPGFIELSSTVGLPKDMRAGGIAGGGGGGGRGMAQGAPAHQQQLDQPGARHWNKRVRPELSVAQRLEINAEETKALRGLGFTAALAAPEAGLFAGQSALLSLRDGTGKDLLLREAVAQHLAFDFAFGNEYPGSLMGAIALIRQTLLDADWQRRQREIKARIEANQALDALQPLLGKRQGGFFRLGDELDFGRADALRREFGLDLVYLGSGYEYRVLDQVRAAARPLVLPLNFPEAPEVEKPDVGIDTGLAELQHWEQAPANPGRVAAAGLPIALTSSGLKEPGKQFWSGLRAAVKAGLSEELALAALTREPARLIGAQDLLGSLEPGRLANIVVADADLFRSGEAKLFETWVEGQRFEHAPIMPADPAGTWALSWTGSGPAEWTVERKGDNLDLSIGETRFKGRREGDAWIVLAPGSLFEASDAQAVLAFSLRGDSLEGFRDLSDGRRLRFAGSRTAAGAPAERKAEAAETIAAIPGYPAGEFARRGLPAQPEALLIRGATLWTNTDEGVVGRGDVLVRRGRIAGVGRDLAVPAGAQVIEAAGLHLTPGLIDAHSHTAIARNVNEPSHAVTAEVRIGDVLDPTDINLYRQLAGGVTSALLLHGSANPMGGQSQTIKLRWGADAEGLKFEGSKPGIKFALGENVKQSNWGDGMRSRYPQTRMGVPELMRDRFNAARAYDAAMRGRGAKPRRDLRLDTLAEILRGERLVHIHSYRHDEILMFARLAEEFALPVGSFTHVLEGYKVADAIRDIGAGASTFSDWWAFKMEVWDAIPYNASLMHEVGVVVSLNSDSNELARRLNTEAAKAVQYGGMDEAEALKLVTLNPARQMGIDARVGSLAVGKDADFVLWSGNPLSGFSRVEQTWIDGRRYFDRETHARDEQANLAERERLLQKALAERARKQSLHVDPPAKPAEAEPYVPGAPALIWAVRQFEQASRDDIVHWLRHHAPARGLYHDGEDVVGCTEHGHQH